MTLKGICTHIALAAGVTLGALNCTEAATINSASASFADVSAAIALAVDGDTVIIPAGTATWTSRLNITHGITLQGATTISGDHYTQVAGTPMSANDRTIIIANPPVINGANYLIVATLSASQTFRLSGITFRQATGTSNSNGAIILTGTCPNVRIDHCHSSLVGQAIHFFGWCYGVVDHCIFDCTATTQPVYIGMDSYGGGISGGSTNQQGDGSWADGPHFGSNQFIFIEDNTINNQGTQNAGTIDATPGGRYVQRYNVLNGVLLAAGHGTETVQRGVRAREEYGNIIYPSSNANAGGWGGVLRSGTLLTYNNAWITNTPSLVGGKTIEVFRAFWLYPPWGAADGANGWDINDTEGNGTYVAGHNPHVFASGTHTGSSGATTLTDSTKNWTPNQWVNYTVTDTTINRPGAILSNTSNTITYYLYNDQGAPLKFNTGDSYQIHKLLLPLDGVGRGKCDPVTRVSGTWTNPVNSTTSTVAWPHNQLEPCYSWDSYNGQPVKIGVSNGQMGTVTENRDFYNFNSTWKPGSPLTTGIAVGTLANRPAQCTPGKDITGVTSNPPGVAYWATDTGPSNQNGQVSGTLYVCTATNTWTQYYQPFQYPHPLVSGSQASPSAPSNLRVVP
jgi:hypothetical protein